MAQAVKCHSRQSPDRERIAPAAGNALWARPGALVIAKQYVWIVIGVLVAFSVLRYALALFVGRGAADTAVGNLLAALIAFFVVVVFMPLRLLRRFFPGSD